MGLCSHVAALKNIEKSCDAIMSRISRLGRKMPVTRCCECLETAGLKICIVCRSFLCLRDRKDHAHPVFLNTVSLLIYCAECDRRYLAGCMQSRQSCTVQVPPKMYKLIPHHPVKGFSNLGNTCYMNAILAVLLNLEAVRDRFLSGDHDRSCCGRKECMICAVKSLFECLYNPGHVVAHKFIHSFWQSAPQFVGFGQHDAHDFFVCLLQRLHDADRPEAVDDAFCDCLFHQTFFGTLRSTLACRRCAFSKTRDDLFVSIPLECSSSIQASVNRFFEPEMLEDRMECSRCMSNTSWAKSIEIGRHPDVLSIHLKRFSYDAVARKIESAVSLPSSLSIDNNTYDVFGIVSHSGTVDYGHYFSHILLSDVWYKIDDEAVSIASAASIPESQSYVVFYIRRKSAAPSALGH